jgi:hypothetical protein
MTLAVPQLKGLPGPHEEFYIAACHSGGMRQGDTDILPLDRAGEQRGRCFIRGKRQDLPLSGIRAEEQHCSRDELVTGIADAIVDSAHREIEAAEVVHTEHGVRDRTDTASSRSHQKRGIPRSAITPLKERVLRRARLGAAGQHSGDGEAAEDPQEVPHVVSGRWRYRSMHARTPFVEHFSGTAPEQSHIR